ncbi:MAG: hypothetical protein HQK52_09195 [Oligoflexia bacterium]|nr:hypothetical protein [Oligoflexia bacterium]
MIKKFSILISIILIVIVIFTIAGLLRRTSNQDSEASNSLTVVKGNLAPTLMNAEQSFPLVGSSKNESESESTTVTTAVDEIDELPAAPPKVTPHKPPKRKIINHPRLGKVVEIVYETGDVLYEPADPVVEFGSNGPRVIEIEEEGS